MNECYISYSNFILGIFVFLNAQDYMHNDDWFAAVQ